ncbi:Cytochrome c-type biogenesis protein CcmE, heme chaperone [hydrothermal vent metagenome]|uniref:Cytochrome c-type biogenesis protein CcmE, heme chaperone n=1 Tax=hydrothermal vent metagenome TaxID=652676 RepID=A0A3B0VSP5_9ZZZZ
MKPRSKRLVLIGTIIAAFGIAVMLVLNAFQENLVFFHTPTEVKERSVPYDRTIRVGGLVEKGSFKREEETTTVTFNVTDGESSILVSYTGILPDLFREGQGIVAEGKLLTSGLFVASHVFAKHDETYMPPEAAEALKRAEEKATVKSVDQTVSEPIGKGE